MRTLTPEAEYQVRRAEAALREREELRAQAREDARRAAAVLLGEFGAQRVILFGSVLHPWFHRGSDLDLAVQGIAPERRGMAFSRLEELLGEGRVDLVMVEEVDEALRRRIEETGEVLA